MPGRTTRRVFAWSLAADVSQRKIDLFPRALRDATLQDLVRPGDTRGTCELSEMECMAPEHFAEASALGKAKNSMAIAHFVAKKRTVDDGVKELDSPAIR